MIKRSYTVIVNMKSGDPITFEGMDAQNFWAMFDNYKRGQDIPAGFTFYTPDEDGKSYSATTLLFKNVVSVKRSPIEEEEVENEEPKMPFCVTFEKQDPLEEVQKFTSEAERRAYLRGKNNVTPVKPSDPPTEDEDKGNNDENGGDVE